MDGTPRFDLPLLAAGQAQKEIYHNEALQRIDALVAPCVAGPPSLTPPPAPEAGDCHLVGAGAAGAWEGHDQSLAMYAEGGWRFIAPSEGMRLWVAGDEVDALYRAGAWELGTLRADRVYVGGTKVVDAQQAAIADPQSGAVVDTQARAVVVQLLGALRAHGLIAS